MMTRAILIDPFTETVMDVTMVDTKLQTIKNLIDCEIITVAGIGTSNQYRGIDLILDDEGLLKDSNHQAYFKYGIQSQPYAGKALMIATDDEGETVSLPESITVEKVSEKVIFFKPSQKTLDESTKMTFTAF
jgi:hypothetical protein